MFTLPGGEKLSPDASLGVPGTSSLICSFTAQPRLLERNPAVLTVTCSPGSYLSVGLTRAAEANGPALGGGGAGEGGR